MGAGGATREAAWRPEAVSAFLDDRLPAEVAPLVGEDRSELIGIGVGVANPVEDAIEVETVVAEKGLFVGCGDSGPVVGVVGEFRREPGDPA